MKMVQSSWCGSGVGAVSSRCGYNEVLLMFKIFPLERFYVSRCGCREGTVFKVWLRRTGECCHTRLGQVLRWLGAGK